MAKKLMIVAICSILLLAFQDISSADGEENTESPVQQRGEDFQRGVEHVRNRGNQEGWDIFERTGALLFGEKSIDPLASTEETTETQGVNTGVGERADTAAQFTQAATNVVQAGTPSPSPVSEVGMRAVDTAVDSATSEQPGFFGKIVRAIGEFFSNLFGGSKN